MRRVEQRHSDGREGGRERGTLLGGLRRRKGKGRGEGDGSGREGGSSRAFSGVESTKRLHKKKNRLRSFSIPL